MQKIEINEDKYFQARPFLIRTYNKSDNFQIIWKETTALLTENKLKYAVFIENIENKDVYAMIEKLRVESGWLKDNAFLSTPSRNLIVVNYKFARTYDIFGAEGIRDFVTWIENKVKSEGHRLSILAEDEFVIPRNDKSLSVDDIEIQNMTGRDFIEQGYKPKHKRYKRKSKDDRGQQ